MPKPVSESSVSEPCHIEVTSTAGACKWVREIVSHSVDQILEAWHRGDEMIIVEDADGAKTAVSLLDTFLIRTQDDAVFKRRSQYVRRT